MSLSKLLPLCCLLILVVACREQTGENSEQNLKQEEPEKVVASNAEAGKSLYTICIACHGPNAEGMRALNAPNLVNQEIYYLKRQLENFKQGIRGTAPEDTFGRQMAPMAATLQDEQAINDVVAYIKSLPPSHPAITLKGDTENGKNYYNMICGACHGPGAIGNEDLHSPRLVGLDDWYMARQLHHFRQDIRGKHPDDLYGAQMKPMADALPTDKEINDVLAYISSLQSK